MADLGAAIGQALGVVEGWLEERGISPVGPPLVRYRVIDMAHELDVEVGVPVAQSIEVADGLVADSLPLGTYGVATYRGAAEGVTGNAALIEWARESGVAWASTPTADGGEAFVCRVETLLGDPDVNPDPATWETEVAILVATA